MSRNKRASPKMTRKMIRKVSLVRKALLKKVEKRRIPKMTMMTILEVMKMTTKTWTTMNEL
jgi:hypothetical protein